MDNLTYRLQGRSLEVFHNAIIQGFEREKMIMDRIKIGSQNTPVSISEMEQISSTELVENHRDSGDYKICINYYGQDYRCTIDVKPLTQPMQFFCFKQDTVLRCLEKNIFLMQCQHKPLFRFFSPRELIDLTYKRTSPIRHWGNLPGWYLSVHDYEWTNMDEPSPQLARLVQLIGG